MKKAERRKEMLNKQNHSNCFSGKHCGEFGFL